MPATAQQSYVPEITTARGKPLIHAEAVALSNDTWQIHRKVQSRPTSWLTVPTQPALLPQSIPTLLFPQTRAAVFTSAASICWSQVDYRKHTIQMDGSNSKLL